MIGMQRMAECSFLVKLNGFEDLVIRVYDVFMDSDT